MPAHLVGQGSPLSATQLERLWQEVCIYTGHTDEEVSVRLVSEEEMRTLNATYRNKERSTNVLTFSYPAVAGTSEGTQHDVALCLSVAETEAHERTVTLEQYVALLLVHAFLHAQGWDHERSEEEADKTKMAENAILEAAGFTALSL
jgi:probable rRNA maturation factor